MPFYEITIRVDPMGKEQLDQKIKKATEIGLIVKVLKI